MHDPEDIPACLRQDSASERTVRKYLKAGYRRLARALTDMKLEPDDLGNPAALEEFVRARETCSTVLAKNTINVYRGEYRAVLRDLVKRSFVPPDIAEKAFERINTALTNQAKDVDKLPPRTAATKACDATSEQCVRLLEGLARQARRGNIKAALVGLTVYLILTFSVRPREALLVRLDGDGLRFPVLKQRRNVVRRFGLLRETRRYGEAWHKGMAAYTAIVEKHAETPEQLDAFYGALSTKLMFVCDELNLPRLCFSVLRHVSAGEFRAAGVSPEMLARALGHKSNRTQHVYGRDVRDARPRAIPASEIVVDIDFGSESTAEAPARPQASEVDEVQVHAPLSTDKPATAVPPPAPQSGIARGTQVEQLAAPQPGDAPRPGIDARAPVSRKERKAAEGEHKRIGTDEEAGQGSAPPMPMPAPSERPTATSTGFVRRGGLAAPDPDGNGLAGSAALPSLPPWLMLPRPPLRETPVADPTVPKAQKAWVGQAQVPALKATEPNGEDEDEDETPSFRM